MIDHQVLTDDKMKEDGMDWVSGTLWREGNEYLIGFRCGNSKERDHLEDLGIDGTILFKWTLSKPH
jgi:hypothetical protein